jgi:3-oxoacyl-(acyl-carrier-protein) synthase|tara:strand:+ start:2214 stop:3410 length:1197 start_codon:yes stop_codon:yes gene_type:complete
MSKVFVTGMGAVSSIGTNVKGNHESLRNGEAGIGKAHFFESKYTENLLFGEVKLSNEDLKTINGIEDVHDHSRTTLLGIHAFNEAIIDANLSLNELRAPRTGLISSSTVGGMCNTDELFADANLNGNPSNFVSSYENSDHTLRIVKQFGLKGYTDTINTACSSSANAIMQGARLIQSGRVDRVIVGGTDSLAKYTVNGFNSLMILSDEACQPFDENRKGLTLGEGSAYLVLEAENYCLDKKKYAEVLGFGNSNDAYHPSSTSEDARGPRLAIKRALSEASLSPEDIDYINAHGTGTENNDVTETFAFTEIFKEVPPYNSTKSYTGHTLAASGSLEAVFSILSLNSGELYPSLRCSSPLSKYPTSPIKEFSNKHEINNVLSNSFGFGGNCTSLIFSKCT